jgi:putative ABC transport system permease protein
LKFLPFIWRNLTRNKLRSLLTGAAIALAISLVCLLQTMPSGLDRLLGDLFSNARVVVHNEAGIVYPLPYSYLEKVRALPGVVGAASWTWFGGVFEADQGVAFPSWALEPEAGGVVWADWKIDPRVLADFQRHRDGAVVGRGTLERYGWKVGDRVTLAATVYPLALDFRIVGEIPSASTTQFWFQREYLEQALAAKGLALDTLGVIWLRIDDPTRIAPLMREVEELFRNGESEVATATERSFFQSLFRLFEGFVAVILVVTGAVALCVVFVAANSASMAVRERLAEIAVLKALGFSRRLIFGTLVAEAVLLCALAGAVGALASLGLTLLMRSLAASTANPQLGPLGSFIVTQTILVQGLFLALFVGMLSGTVPAWGAARRSVAATLRETF